MVRVKDLKKYGKLRESPAIQSGHVCEDIVSFSFCLDVLQRFILFI